MISRIVCYSMCSPCGEYVRVVCAHMLVCVGGAFQKPKRSLSLETSNYTNFPNFSLDGVQSVELLQKGEPWGLVVVLFRAKHLIGYWLCQGETEKVLY